MKVSFEGTKVGNLSFEAGSAVTPGFPVSLSGNRVVSNAAEGVAPVGVCVWVRKGVACVQVSGYTTLPYSGTAPALGVSAVKANGNGGVSAASSGGLTVRVLEVDTTAGTVGVLLN
jgi:hypothetical protein